IAAWADVAAGVHGAAADGTEGAAGLHQLGGAGGEGLGLLAADTQARGAGLLALALAFFFLLEQLDQVHDDAVAVLVVAHADVGHRPDGGLDRLDQLRLARQTALGRAQLGDDALQVVPQRAHLLLLALEAEELAALARLDVEGALARLADGAGGEEVGLLVVVGLAHLRPKAERSPAVELTVRTATPEGR